MLEQLLQRIALKGAASHALHQPDEAAFKALRSGDGQHSGYPATATNISALHSNTTDATAAAKLSSAAWTRAKLAYQYAHAKGTLTQPLAACFAGYGDAHRAVAALLWTQRGDMKKGLFSICSKQDVIAYVQPQERTVLLRKMPDLAKLGKLHCQRASDRSGELPAASKAFQSTSIDMLLWFYGQTCSAAPDLLSHKLVQQALHLRKLPAVDAKALELRHLTLIQHFSAGAFFFDDLQRSLAAPQTQWLCADLASLYLVDALSPNSLMALQCD